MTSGCTVRVGNAIHCTAALPETISMRESSQQVIHLSGLNKKLGLVVQ